jgi:hypothetical protein
MREAGTSFTWSLSTTQDEGSYDVKTVSAPRSQPHPEPRTLDHTARPCYTQVHDLVP